LPSRQKRREYGNISEYFNDEGGKIYILKPTLALVVKAIIPNWYNKIIPIWDKCCDTTREV